MALDELKHKLEAFNWKVLVVDGNDIDEVDKAFEEAKKIKGAPTVIIANTVKGKGSPIMENKAAWHHHLPSEDEYSEIIKDLENTRKELSNE